MRSSAVKSAASIKPAYVIEAAVGENSAVGDIAVVIEHNSVTAPIVSPMSPAPAKAAKQTDSKAKAKRNSRNSKVKSGIRIPARPDSDGPSIHEPWVVFGNVNNLRVSRLDDDGLPLLADLFLLGIF